LSGGPAAGHGNQSFEVKLFLLHPFTLADMSIAR